MVRRRQQFTIGSLMVVIAIVAFLLAFPAIPALFLIVLVVAVPLSLAGVLVVLAPFFTLSWMIERRENSANSMARRQSFWKAFGSFLTSTHANLEKEPTSRIQDQGQSLDSGRSQQEP